MLNARGVLSPAEYKKAAGVSYHTPFSINEKPEWSPNGVKRILSNRVYIGCLEQGKRTKASYRVKRFYYKPREQWSVHENAHEPIVDALDFELAQELMAMDTRSAHGGSPLHLFSGFAVCGSCGQPMTAKTTAKRNGKTYINYICSTHKKTGGCQNNNVSEIKLSGIVLTAIQRQVSGLMEAREIDNGAAASTLKSRKRAAIEEMIGRNLQAIEENSDYLVKSYVHFNDGVISEAEYQMFKNSFNSQIKTAEGNITALRGELDSLHDNARAKRLIERFVEYGNITELNRRIVAGLIKTVTVNSNQDVAINFRYTGDVDMPYDSERAVV